MSRFIENKLINEFKGRESFTREELFEFFLNFEPDLKSGTFGWKIYDLKQKNIIQTLQRGVYTITEKTIYIPDIAPELINLSKKIAGNFEGVNYCIWETGWLNEFSQHQSSRRIIIIDFEKEFAESLYYYLKDNQKQDLYLNPDERVIDFYISESNQPIIIKNMITRSPIGKISEYNFKLSTPLLEKILVDLIAEEKLLHIYQGAELSHIYENAVNNYSINFTTLFSYARRRQKEQKVKALIMKHVDYPIK